MKAPRGSAHEAACDNDVVDHQVVGKKVTVHDFRTEQVDELTVDSSAMDAASGHGGGDAGLMDAFTRALATGDASHILSGPAESLETHLAVFAAERARHTRTVEPVA